MSDNLTVFGTDYTNVTGIKATGTGNGTLTYIRPQGTKSISANGTGIDVAAYASVDVDVDNTLVVTLTQDSTTGNWLPNKTFAQLSSAYTDGKSIVFEGAVQEQESCPVSCDWYSSGTDFYYRVVWFDYYEVIESNGYYYYDTYRYDSNGLTRYNRVILDTAKLLQAKTGITPTTSSQTITPDAGYDGLSSVQINAMPSGTAGTPLATKGSVSNHAISVTPSVTNTTGYITGGTKTGTAVSVSASELVSGTYTVSASGTHDVTNYASASVAAGGATASATKGTVSNHRITVTPSVTRTAGYVTAGTANGTAVSVSASELVSGSETKTANGTYDVTNLASLVVDVPIVTYYTSSSAPTSSQGSDGDIWLVTA